LCGAALFDNREVEAIHALVDAARDVGRGKSGTSELTLAMKAG